MKTKILGLIFVTLNLLNGCGQISSESKADFEIYGGSVVHANWNDPRYTATVALTTDSLRSQGRSFCTGTLYANRVVITAAHCVTDGRGNPPVQGRMLVTFGTYSNLQAQAAYVMRTIVHPEYRPNLTTTHNPQIPPNDIALLILDRGAPAGFRPIHIFEEQILNNQEVQVAGFGVTKNRSSGDTGTLRATSAKLRALEGVAKRFTTMTWLSGACPGDSGGPAYIVRNGRWALFGIVSTGVEVMGNCLVGQNSFTDARHYFHWVRQNAGR